MYQFDGLTLNIFLSELSSDRHPYLEVESTSEDMLNVVINLKHPHVRELSGRMGILNHLKGCAYEGVAQWKVQSTWGDDRPELIRVMKDALLRIGSIAEDT